MVLYYIFEQYSLEPSSLTYIHKTIKRGSCYTDTKR